MKLTQKQAQVLEYLSDYIKEKGQAPSFEEICKRFGFRSYNTVTTYLAALERKGYIKRPLQRNRKRAIELTLGSGRSLLPLLGRVAAGRPIEAIQDNETIEVPGSMLGRGEYFVLKVEGSSMVEDGILDGDFVVVRRQPTAENGDTVVALIGDEATLKRYYRIGDRIELRPANKEMAPIVVRDKDLRIEGKVVGVIRYYK
ncbi:MAG: transcriptional repressor LexA [Desulfatiglandales bacterium]